MIQETSKYKEKVVKGVCTEANDPSLSTVFTYCVPLG